MSDRRVPEDWVVVAECSSGSEASLIQGRLQQEDIESQVLAARGAPGAWLTGAEADWAPKVVVVPAGRQELALSLLASEAYEEDDDPGVELPEFVDEPGAAPLTFMGAVRASAGVIAFLLALGLAWAQCGP